MMTATQGDRFTIAEGRRLGEKVLAGFLPELLWSRDLTYGEDLKLSTLAAFGTVGIAVLPYQRWRLSHNTHWPIELGVWLAIFSAGSAWTGALLLRNLYSAFSVRVIRKVP